MTLLRSSLGVGLALRIAMFAASSIATAPATAAEYPRETPLAIAAQRQALTSGGLYRPDAASSFPRFQAEQHGGPTL